MSHKPEYYVGPYKQNGCVIHKNCQYSAFRERPPRHPTVFVLTLFSGPTQDLAYKAHEARLDRTMGLLKKNDTKLYK